MSRVAVYDNHELVERILAAHKAVKNTTRLCINLRGDNAFRLKYGLDQASVDALFTTAGVKAPRISLISFATIKSILNGAKKPIAGVSQDGKPGYENPVLRQHQEAAITAIKQAIHKGTTFGRIVLPTGTGKTRIEAETIVELIDASPDGGIYVVLAPRILLTYQLLNNIGKVVTAHGKECNFLNVNSGDFDSVKFAKLLIKMGVDHPEKIESTTKTETIKTKILQAKEANKPLLIFSTYHSVGRVDEAVKQTESKVDCYIYDEAQYCVTSGDFKEVPNFDSKYKFFFTATEKHADDADKGIGMNNENKFGEILYAGKPKSLIGQGEMVSVAIHLVGAREYVGEKNYESKARVVVEAFDKHRRVLKGYSAQPDAIGPKLLVVCDKQDSLKGMIQSDVLKAYKEKNPHVKVYALSSDFGIHIEGITSPRVTNKEKEELFAALNDLEDTDEAIIFHVDMLAEGIDIPGITGILPFRNLSKIKFLQNMGRGTRLVDLDRKALYGGLVTPKDWKHYIKPFCWVVLPIISDEYYDLKRRFTRLIQDLRSDDGFDTSDLAVVDNIKGPPIVKEIEDITGNVTKKFPTGQDIITEIIHEIEESETMTKFMDHAFEFKKLTLEEQLHLITDVFKAA